MIKKLNRKQIILIASTLFGMLFGAGNLIFPVHLGQLAGNNIILSTLGFVVTGVGIPILGVIAIGASESRGLFSLCTKASKTFAFIFTTILYLSIGPCFVIPRSASISYNSGVSILLNDPTGKGPFYIVFCILFFIIVAIFSFRPSGITVWIGKIINPVFLTCLGILLIVALTNPMGDVSQIAPIEDAAIGHYQTQPFFNGFLQGYATMDALAGLAFGIIIIDIVKKMGIKDKTAITKNMFKSSVLTAIAMALIYTLTIIMGVESRGMFDLSSNGSIALSQISTHYFGAVGDIVMATIVTLASLKTCIGLVTSCSTAFVDMYPKSKYNVWAVIFLLVSFIISNAGLDTIIEFTTPVLSFLCPIAIILIILAFSGRFFDHASIVYRLTLIFASIPAVIDFLIDIPSVISQYYNVAGLTAFRNTIFPFAEIGFSWLVPACIGAAIGLTIYFIKKRKQVQTS